MSQHNNYVIKEIVIFLILSKTTQMGLFLIIGALDYN